MKGIGGLALAIAATSGVHAQDAGEHTISSVPLRIGDWALVATLTPDDVVDGFVAIQTNSDQTPWIDHVWYTFQEDGTEKFHAVGMNAPEAIRALKMELGISDALDEFWPIDVPSAYSPADFNQDGIVDGSDLSKVLAGWGTFDESIDLDGDGLIGGGELGFVLGAWGPQSEPAEAQWESTNFSPFDSECTEDTISQMIAEGSSGGYSLPESDCANWVEMSLSLMPDGTWTVENFQGYLEAATGMTSDDAWQSIPIGTVLHGPQVVVIQAGGVIIIPDDANSAQFVVRLDDISVPETVISLIGDNPRSMPAAPYDYYTIPTAVKVQVAVTDGVDESPELELWHNGEPYSNGSEISEVGVHTISARSRDRSGNASWTSEMFEIRKRPNHGAEIYVDDIQTETDANGVQQAYLDLLVTAEQFDMKRLNPSTIDLWLLEDDGTWVAAASTETPIIDYEDCRYRLRYTLDLSGSTNGELPPNLAITARGATGTLDEYDVLATQEMRVAIPPFIAPCEDRGDPDPPLDAECEWVTQSNFPPPQKCLWANFSFVPSDWFTPGSASVMSLWVTPTQVAGSGYCWVSGVLHGDVSSSCALTNGGTVNVFLNGDNCCNQCIINVSANPSISGTVFVDPTASVDMSGSISIGVGGASATAAGSISLAQDGSGTMIINDFLFPLPAGTLRKSWAAPASPPLNQDFHTCNLSATISTMGAINTNAQTGWTDWRGEARGTFTGSQLGLDFNPRTECDDIDPIPGGVISY